MADPTPTAPPQNPASLPISVIVIGGAEGVEPGPCRRRNDFSDDVVIVDRRSVGRDLSPVEGVRILRMAGTTTDQAIDRALHEANPRHPWSLVLDAYDVVPGAMLGELKRLTQDDRSAESIHIPHHRYFMGRRLRFGHTSAGTPACLLRTGTARTAPARTLEHHLHRHLDGDGLLAMLRGDNFRSQMDADAAYASGERRAIGAGLGLRVIGLFLRDYLLRLGVLDGRAGFHHAAMTAMLDYWTRLKVCEHDAHWKPRTIALADEMIREPER